MMENEIATVVVGAASHVHRSLGPGLFESVYEPVFAYELRKRGLDVACQVPISVAYDGVDFDEGFRADILVESTVIVELKTVESLSASHSKQIQTYLKLSGLKLDWLLNFSAALLRDGIVRCVNGLEE